MFYVTDRRVRMTQWLHRICASITAVSLFFGLSLSPLHAQTTDARRAKHAHQANASLPFVAKAMDGCGLVKQLGWCIAPGSPLPGFHGLQPNYLF
jgi:hypothetical protein